VLHGCSDSYDLKEILDLLSNQLIFMPRVDGNSDTDSSSDDTAPGRDNQARAPLGFWERVQESSSAWHANRASSTEPSVYDRRTIQEEHRRRPIEQRLSLRSDNVIASPVIAELTALAHQQSDQLVRQGLVPPDDVVLPRTWPTSIHGVRTTGLPGIFSLRLDHQRPPHRAWEFDSPYTWYDPFHPETPNGFEVPAADPSLLETVDTRSYDGEPFAQELYAELWFPSDSWLPASTAPWLCIRWLIIPQEYLAGHIPATWVEDQISLLVGLWDRTRPWNRYQRAIGPTTYHVIEQYFLANFASACRYSEALLDLYLRRLTDFSEPNVVAQVQYFRNSYPSLARITTLGPEDHLVRYERPILVRPSLHTAWLDQFRLSCAQDGQN